MLAASICTQVRRACKSRAPAREIGLASRYLSSVLSGDVEQDRKQIVGRFGAYQDEYDESLRDKRGYWLRAASGEFGYERSQVSVTNHSLTSTFCNRTALVRTTVFRKHIKRTPCPPKHAPLVHRWQNQHKLQLP